MTQPYDVEKLLALKKLANLIDFLSEVKKYAPDPPPRWHENSFYKSSFTPFRNRFYRGEVVRLLLPNRDPALVTIDRPFYVSRRPAWILSHVPEGTFLHEGLGPAPWRDPLPIDNLWAWDYFLYSNRVFDWLSGVL